jgi:TATA-box binding protein (TBP) (component of TFIID and TFIIIB)
MRLKSKLALMFDYTGYEVSLFNGGRMLIKGVSSEEEALRAYREIIRALNAS